MSLKSDNKETLGTEIERPFLIFCRIFVQNRSAAAAALTLGIVIILSFFGPIIYGVDPFDIVARPLTPPGKILCPLGADYLGRDLLAGILHGGRATLAVGVSAALVTVFIGITVGALAGYYRGWIDEFLMRLTEFFQVLPTLLFSMVLVALFGASLEMIALAIGLVSWTGVTRVTRAEFLRIRELEYVKAARSNGAGNNWIIWLVILPNALPPLIIQSALIVGVAILFEGGLSFLGLSDPNTMSWGLIIGSNRAYIMQSPWGVIFPGFMIFITVLAISLIGDGLNDALNPKLRQR